MTYYVTGANGFIGREVCKYLEGENVVKIQRPLKNSIQQILDDSGFVFIHLGAYGNHYFQDEVDNIIQSNINDLKLIVDTVRCTNFVKFYNVSTSSVTLPKQTLYSASKLFGEVLIDSFQDARMVNVRPYSVYGPGEAKHRFIPTVIRALHSGEKIELDTLATHDWILCEDFVRAMFNGHKNIGTGWKATNLAVVQMLEQISGKRLNWTPKKMRSYDNYSWVCQDPVPHTLLFEGLKKTYELTPKD